jgi:Caspase domain/WD domain, G-beta repeat/PQQ-like domain
MKFHYIIAVLLIGMYTLVSAFETHARAPVGVMRARSRAVQRAVMKNIDILIRPRLTVARGGTGPVSALTLSRDEKFLITAVGDHTIRLWDMDMGREVARLSGHKSRITTLAVSPDGRMVASAGSRGNIRLWDLKELKLSLQLDSALKKVRDLTFTPEGDRLITGSADGKIRLWDVGTGKEVSHFAAHDAGINSLCIGGNDESIISAEEGGKVSLHDLTTGRHIMDYEGKTPNVKSVVMGIKGKLVAGAGSNGDVSVWDAQTGKLVWKRKGHDGPATSVTINEAAGILVSGGADGRVWLWDVEKGRKLKPLGEHKGPVNFVQLDMEGAYVLTASEDGMTRLWNTLSGNLLVSLISTKTGWAIVDSKGRFDGNESSLDGIEWQTDDIQLPIENFTQQYYEPALLPRLKEDPKSLSNVRDIPKGIHLPPEVKIIAPDASKVGTRGIVTVEVTAREQGKCGIDEVRLYRNGKLVGESEVVDKKEVKEDDGSLSVIKRYDLKLSPGQNLLDAIAINEEHLESMPTSLRLGEGEPDADVRLRLITIGINKYKNHKLNLQYAENDADSIRGFFISDRPMPFISNPATYLKNNQATKNGILDNIRSLRHVPPQDIAIVYMAGHGVSIEDEWYFIPFELERPNIAANIIEKGLSSRELKREIEAISANRVFLIIDACHSGTAISPIMKFRGMKSLRMLAKTTGVHILAATDRNQFSVEVHKLGHGVFTYSLLNALKGLADQAPRDQIISVRETMQYVEDQVPVLSKRYANYTQYPTAHSRGIDFDLSRYKAE